MDNLRNAGIFSGVIIVLAGMPLAAGGPNPPQAMPTPPGQGFINYQSLGFLNTPAPLSAYTPPRGGSAGIGYGISPYRNFGPTNARGYPRRQYGTGIYPFVYGYGGFAPSYFATPGDYGMSVDYASSIPPDAVNGLEP